jgi:hypothetical protein
MTRTVNNPSIHDPDLVHGSLITLRSPSVSRAKLGGGRGAWVVGPVWRVTSLQLRG